LTLQAIKLPPLPWMRRWGLPARVLAILAVVMLLDFGANALLFQRANDFALQEEQAARLAESLTTAIKLLEAEAPQDRARLAQEMTSPALSLRWAPHDERPVTSLDLAGLQRQLVQYQPSLARNGLQLHLAPIRLSHGLVGTLVLADGSVVTFSSHTQDTWPLKAGHILRMLLPTAALAPLAWLLVFASLRPLRKLVRASRHVGTPHARPLEETGPVEVQALIRAFNAMQRRIDDLLDANTQTVLAIGHDLRTPLARMQLRLDALEMDEEDRIALDADISEMRDLFTSLQSFVDADAADAAKERVDVAIMAQTLVESAEDRGFVAEYRGPNTMPIVARSLSLRRALSNLVENALHYAGDVQVIVTSSPREVVIRVEDTGPGIPDESLGKVLQPFIRLDAARKRDTAGMGLGLAIVDRAIRAEGGALDLSNRPEGGLCATIRLPIIALPAKTG
jgi:signal transduction histidine kinase